MGLHKFRTMQKCSLAFCALFLVTTAAYARADEPKPQLFDIDPQALTSALAIFARQSHEEILYAPEIVATKRTAGVKGTMEPIDALRVLLKDTGLPVSSTPSGAILVGNPSSSATQSTSLGASASDDPGAQDTKEAGKKSSQGFRVAQATSGQIQENVAVDKPDNQGSEKAIQLEQVVVTGSRIPRSQMEQTMEVKLYTKEQIEESGQTTVADFLNTVPEVSQAYTEGQQSQGGGTTVQLHGLPVGTTLVLLNGQRVEQSGAQGVRNFFDLNSIPLAAVERIEVVPEGSSAIYGSDAVAGIVNIILRKSLNGVEASVKYGRASGTGELSTAAAAGKNWDRGSLSVFGSFLTRSGLSTDERAITASQDYRAFGANDSNVLACSPGNVFSIDGSNLPGVGASFAAVPAGFNGRPTQQEFLATAGKLHECSQSQGATLIPQSRRASILALGSFRFAPSLELFTELLYSHVEQIQEYGFPYAGYAGGPGNVFFTVPASNPFNPFGETVGVAGQIPGFNYGQRQTNIFLRELIGARGDFLARWHWEIVGFNSQDRTDDPAFNYANSAAIQDALNSTDPSTALNPFTAGPPGSAGLLRSLESNSPSIDPKARTLDLNGFVHGPIADLPAGPIEMLVGGEYERRSLDFPPVFADRRHSAIFGETRIPVVPGPASNVVDPRLVASVAGRHDTYGDFGGKTTPQFGAEWKPIEALLVRATYGRAFAAPNLLTVHSPSNSFPTAVLDPLNGNRQEIVNGIYGGNPSLRPETGRSNTIGLAYASSKTPDLQVLITHWDVRLDEAIQFIQPQVIVNNADLFPSYVVRAPGRGGQPGAITQVTVPFGINFGTIDVKGFDYQARYKHQTSYGALQSLLTITQTYDYKAALVPNSPATDRTSIASDDMNWAPRWKGTLALNWTTGPLAANLAARYVGRYRDYDPLLDGTFRSLGNFWLCDINLRVALDRFVASQGAGSSWPNSTYITLGAVNLFNRLPQFSNFQFGTVGYDPSEGDIRGRFAYAELGIKW